MSAPINPKPYLATMVGKYVSVRLKWNDASYVGRLVSLDSYINLQLTDTEEYLGDKSTGKLGNVLIRCNNVLWVRLAPAELVPAEQNGDAAP